MSRSVVVEMFIVVGWTLAGRISRAHTRLLQHIRQLIESLSREGLLPDSAD